MNDKSIYLFDFDGTLADSMPYYSEEMRSILKEHNCYSEEIIKLITPMGFRRTAEFFIREFHMPYEADALVERFQEELIPAYRDKILLKPGIPELLRKLKDRGASVNVLTASPFKIVAPTLKRCGVFELFDHVWSCDDFQMPKSNPEIYRLASERAGGTIEEAVFLDDNLEALKAGVQSGIYTIGVYDSAGEDYKEEIKELVDLYLESFEEVSI